jgi:hypothetical protein
VSAAGNAAIQGLDKIAKPQLVLPCDSSISLIMQTMQGPSGELRALAPNMRELDLADNLLPRWTEAACLAEEAPDLASLNLSLNPMAWPSGLPGAAAVTPFRRLKTLVLNQCCIGWPQVLAAPISQSRYSLSWQSMPLPSQLHVLKYHRIWERFSCPFGQAPAVMCRCVLWNHGCLLWRSCTCAAITCPRYRMATCSREPSAASR